VGRLSVRSADGEVRQAETSPTLSLLNAMLRAGVPVRHDCGGKALCGTCRFLPRGGLLSPPDGRESARLAAAGAPPGARLSCQAHAARDAEIELLLPPAGEGGA